MKPCTFGLMIFLLIIIWKPGLTYGSISNKERNALETLYNKTGGGNWFNKENWKKAPGTEPTWNGITCDTANTTVLKIELHGNNLQGDLPTDIDAFPNLTTLNLSNNQLSGEIPSCIKRLKNLKKLDLSGNRFDGPIPTWIGRLKNLEELLLDNNKLDGAIPKELAKLRNLKILRLGCNRLTGEIPTELVKLVNLEDNQSNFKWNALYTQNVNLKDFLQKKQINWDWESTQTTVPSHVKVIKVTEDTVTIKWQPIAYTADTGGYQVFYREEWQPYDDRSFVAVKDKKVTETSIKGLKKCTKYHFKIRTWTRSHSMKNNKIESPFSNQFTAVTRGIIISGTIKNQKDGNGVPGVHVRTSNGFETYTKGDGNYNLSVIPGWIGTVTPFKEGIKFSPIDRKYVRVESDITDEEYTAEFDTVISGKVTYNGKGVGDVTLKFTGENGDNYTTLTDENGNYEKEVSYNWSGSVTPIKERHQFKPPQNKYEKVNSRHEGKNYELQLPKVFGRVKTLIGKGLSGIRLKFSNIDTEEFKYLKDYAITNKKGNYEIGVLENWIGRVLPKSPQKTMYLFYPTSRETETSDDIKKTLNFRVMRYFKYFVLITFNYINLANYFFNSSYYSVDFLYPELTFAFKFNRKFYISSGFGFIAKGLNIDFLEEPGGWIKKSFSIGIGYYVRLFPYIHARYNVGVVRFRYKNDIFNDKVSAVAWGVRLEQVIIININDRWFTEIPLGWLLARNGSYSRIGISLGYRF